MFSKHWGEIDQKGISPKNESAKFDLYHHEKRYPPKEVLKFANRIANDDELIHFTGGDLSNNYLINPGFTIVLKNMDKGIEVQG